MLNASDLRRMMNDGGEIAVLDVREEGVCARDGHLLLASNVPLSHLEMRVPALVPLESTRIVVCDGNEGLAPIACARLTKYGYTDVNVLEGGAPAWAAAGEKLYTGQYVPSKAFGEYVYHCDQPPEVTATELDAWKNDGRDLLILDSRPMEEYHRKTIPGSIDCPSAELGYRVHDLLRSEKTTVVVNCGGRTRAIIGAQALINAGLQNKVYALKDGTQGWHLAGFPLELDRTDHAPAPSPRGLELARTAAARVARRFGVRTMGKARLQSLQAERRRTVYILDVRTPEEFEAGHLPGSIHAPGGQLVQATDTWLAVRHATVFLVDNDGVRATMTAAWLIQMGWEHVFVLADALNDGPLAFGPGTPDVLGLDALAKNTIAPLDLKRLLLQNAVEVIDLDNSLNYREGHIPNAWHAVRSRLAADIRAIPKSKPLVLTSPDGVLAELAAADLAQLVTSEVKVLSGGTNAWRAAGQHLEKGDTRMTGPPDDVNYRAFDRQTGVENAMREYLQWEVDLLNAVEADSDFQFRRFP